MTYMAGLAVFSGLSLNLLLQFALGTATATSHVTKEKSSLPFFQLGVLFFSVLFLWLLFGSLIPGFLRGFSEFFLYFPFSALLCMGLELIGNKTLPSLSQEIKGIKKSFNAYTAYDGLVPASLLITQAAARNFADAFVLALFFTIGNMAAMLILNEIRRRSSMERIPRYLRGIPLVLISMGLLSLIFASAAWIFFRILEAL